MADADVRWLQRLENYSRALATLEFTHELSWLLLKDFLVDQGVSRITGSRDAV
jgi:hypothetical protein